MILRGLNPAAPSSDRVLPAWEVIDRQQRMKHEQCWMITQPSHAVLAGELATKLHVPYGPRLEPDLTRAIALHDAGWGTPDAKALIRSRSPRPHPPRSFVEAAPAEFLEAWMRSIETAQAVSPAGGYVVSRHFQRIAERHNSATAEDQRKLLGEFTEREGQRQKELAAGQHRNLEELELLTDVLQLCDLLSLYICCGAQDSVELPESLGCRLHVGVETGGYRLDPPVIDSGSEFSVAALRHPPVKGVSGHRIDVRIS